MKKLHPLLLNLASSLTIMMLCAVVSQFSHANESSHAALAQNDSFNKSLSEAEFNSLLIASLANNPKGKKLLSVSDAISAKLYPSKIEISAVINLDKVEKISPEAKNHIEKFDAFFFFLDKNQLNVKVIGEPIARNGLFGIRDNFSIELGPIPLSNDMLRQLGLDVEQANNTNLRLNGLHTHAIKLSEGRADLAIAAISKK